MFTIQDTITANQDLKKVSVLQIVNGILILDKKAEDFEFITITENEKIKGVEFRSELKKLKYFNLARCKISKIIFPAGCCQNIKAIHLEKNGLENIVFEENLGKLEILGLNKNSFEQLNLPFAFESLKYIDVSKNKNLKDFSALGKFIFRENFDFSLIESDNLKEPPPEIVKQGNDAIRRHFKRISEQGKDYIYEAKLLILGEGGAGKTTLTEKLKDPYATLPTESTKGIDVHKIFLPYNEKKILLNIWDFAGQEIYNSTHRFFLTHRSLYIIVADARKNDTDFYYWLNTVETFGENSPVLILINEKFDHEKKLDISSLRAIYPNLKEKFDSNLEKLNKDYDKLKKNIEFQVANLDHIGTSVSANWKTVRDELLKKEKENVKAISLKNFRILCNDFGITDKNDFEDLCKLFHDLGVFLHFSDNRNLRNIIFLDKDWILNAAYLVIDNDEIKNKGKFTVQDIEHWLEAEYYDYIDKIIALMKKFYLIYEKNDFFVAPLQLPVSKPNYIWYKVDNLVFIFDYGYYMPAGILAQFIVEMHKYIDNDNVWLEGVILEKNKNTKAEIIEIPNKKKIIIKTFGIEKEEFRSQIVGEIEKINRQYKKLKVKRLIPCICADCLNPANNTHFFDYNFLLNAKAKGALKVQCQESVKDVPLSELLSSIKIEQHLENKQMNTEKQINVNVSVVNGNGNTSLTDVKAKDIKISQNRSQEETKEKTNDKPKFDKQTEDKKKKFRRRIFWWIIVTLVVTTVIAVVINHFYPSIWSWIAPYVVVVFLILPFLQKILNLIKTTIDIADKY